jgi:poly-gamma-glutamate capsule biosynthesis protein CapA/YwtB (metallophosphatase superfamily)
MNPSITLMACGDVGPIHEPLPPYTDHVSALLASADLRFGQVERVYTERGALQVHSGGEHSRVKPHMAAIMEQCGFDVVSVASNHAMDWGPDALLDSIALLRSKGMATAGAGRNLREAREPAIVERNGVRVAFLAYCSVLRDGYAAQAEKPGVAPLRAHTYYRTFDYQAGVPPITVTVPYEEDLEGMVADIAAAKKSAHAVIVSLHWGVHFIPKVIADYQPVVAKAAFEAGADLILGHHAHVPKAIGVYAGGKVCFYSLSNFIMSSTPKNAHSAQVFEQRYGVKLDPDYPRLPYGSDAKRSLIAKATITPQGVQQVSFIPALIDTQLRPEPLRQKDPRFADAVAFMESVSEGFPHRFTVEGNEVLVQAPAA